MYGIEGSKTAPSLRAGEEYPQALCSASLEAVFRRCADFQTRRLRVGTDVEIFVSWIDGLISSFETAEELLRPLADPRRVGAGDAEGCFAALREGAVSCPALDERRELDSLCEDLTHGRCAFVFDALGRRSALTLRARRRALSASRRWKSRSRAAATALSRICAPTQPSFGGIWPRRV